MDEQAEMELGQEAQYQHETQLEQWLAELQKDNKQLRAEVKELKEALEEIQTQIKRGDHRIGHIHSAPH